jgi:hypothetical protein
MIKKNIIKHRMGIGVYGSPMDIHSMNRCVMTIPTEGGSQQFWVRLSSGPRMEVREQEIPFMSTSTWNRHRWEPIEVRIIDPIGVESSTQILMEWVRSYSTSMTGRQGYASNYKKNITLEQYDPTGIIVSKWDLHGTFISSASFNAAWDDFDYQGSDFNITINFDYANLII